MIPLRDHNPTHAAPVVTIGLIVANVAVFLLGVVRPDGGERMVWKYGYLPAGLSYDREEIREALVERAERAPPVRAVDRFGRVRLFRPPPPPVDDAVALPAFVKLLTCMFMHGGLMHLAGNMLYLWIFGNNIEDRLGRGLFIMFYLVTGVFGTIAHTLIDMDGLIPLVGASGAISGVLGAYIILFPRARVEALVPIGWYLTTIQLPAYVFLGFYALLQFLNGVPALWRHSGSGIAYWAHIGGFVAGLALIKLLPQRRLVPRARPVYTRDEPDDAWDGF